MGGRLGFGLSIVLAVAISLAGILNYLNFEKTYDELRSSAYSVLLQDSADSIEYALSLGLSLDSLEGTSQRLADLRGSSPYLIGARIIDSNGVVLFGDESDKIMPERLLGHDAIWSLRDKHSEWLGVPLRNAFDQAEGALILTIDRTPSQRAFGVVARELGGVGLAIILGFSLLAALLTAALLRRLGRQILKLADALNGEKLPPGALPPGFENPLHACRSTIATVERSLDAASSEPLPVPEHNDATNKTTSAHGHRFVVLSIAAVLLLASVAALSFYSARVFERELTPLMTFKAEIVTESLQARLERVAEFGVPLDELRGLNELFAQIAERNPDLGAFELVDPSERVIERWNPSDVHEDRWIFEERQLEVNSEVIGTIRVAPAPNYARQRMNEIGLDILVMVVVAGLVSAEILLFLVAQLIHGPLQSLRLVMQNVGRGVFTRVAGPEGNDPIGRVARLLNDQIRSLNLRMANNAELPNTGWQWSKPGSERLLVTEQLGYIRPPFFLAIFAEALSLSFMPVYAGALAVEIPGLSPEFIAGLPISAFMLVWAISLPFAGQWSDKVGRRRALLYGLLIMSFGLALTALANDLWTLIGSRCLAAVGYAVVFITAQGYVTDHTSAADRTRGMAMFLSTFFSGALCGAAIGGILADRIGFQNTFIAGGILGLGALLFVWLFIADPPDRVVAKSDPLSWRDFVQLFRNRDFVVITFLSAIPAKIALTGFLYFAGPLYLVSLGLSQSVTGRVLMLYGLAIVLFSPLASRLADRLGKRESFMIAGGLLAGMALVAGALLGSVWGIGIAVLLLGLAHAAGVPPQLSVITERIAARMGQGVSLGKTVGIFRLTERVGNVSGPMLAGVLIALVGFQGAIGWLGGLLLLAALSLLVLLMTARASQENGETSHD